MAIRNELDISLLEVVNELGAPYGEHDGSSDVSVLSDSTASWTVDALIGKTIWNLTDGSNGVIIDNTATTITSRGLAYNILGVEETLCNIIGYSDLDGSPNTLEFEHNGIYLNSILEVGDEVELNAPGYNASPKVITAVGSFTFQFEEADGGDPTGGQVRVASGGYQSVFENDGITFSDGDSLTIGETSSYNGTYSGTVRGIDSSHFALPVNYSSDETGVCYNSAVSLSGGTDNDWDSGDQYYMEGESIPGNLSYCFDVAVNAKFDSDYGGDSYAGAGTGWDRLSNFINYNALVSPPAFELIDWDGNLYTSVTIGSQKWMVENWKCTKNGLAMTIPEKTMTSEWESQTNTSTGARCYYLNDSSYKSTYGLLYNWYTVNHTMFQFLPSYVINKGWRIPSKTDWETLVATIGGDPVGGSMKEAGTTHWDSPNTDATNSTGFTSLPGMVRDSSGSFVGTGVGEYAYYWSSTAYDTDDGYYMWNGYSSNGYVLTNLPKKMGMSIRLVKDA